MIELDQMKLELQQYETPLEEVRDSLDLDYKKQRIEELSRESEAPDFWNDADTANKKMKQLKDLQTLVEEADNLSTSYEEMMTRCAPWFPGSKSTAALSKEELLYSTFTSG